MTETDPARYWDARYAERERIWSGNPNRSLVDVVSGIPVSGRALELGCGEGADALWLARLGWAVTAIDISPTALARGRAAAQAAGVDERILWIEADLAEWGPDESYELVTASFLQSTLPLPTSEILRRTAGAIPPGGHLVVITHAEAPPGSRHHEHELPGPQGRFTELGLDPGEWETTTLELRDRDGYWPDGTAAVLRDAVIVVRRR